MPQLGIDSTMRPIPISMREELSEDPRMKYCVCAYKGFGFCTDRIEFHHVWIYAGSQINEKWAIVGICVKHHKAVQSNPLVKQCAERESLKLATEENLAKYPRKDWNQIRKSLESG